ncbi:hypothetical protein ACFKHW_05485 [Bradyrhizobium lupini]|uniref:hypothetical protein n=1 Tax=Rhizobium lupini TaxID=136996 RepID=UPI00366C482A
MDASSKASSAKQKQLRNSVHWSQRQPTLFKWTIRLQLGQREAIIASDRPKLLLHDLQAQSACQVRGVARTANSSRDSTAERDSKMSPFIPAVKEKDFE